MKKIDLFVALLFCSYFAVSGQSTPLSKLHERQYGQNNMFYDNEISLESYYNNNIKRSDSWEYDNPQGSNTSQKTNVTVPAENGIIFLIFMAVFYALIKKRVKTESFK